MQTGARPLPVQDAQDQLSLNGRATRSLELLTCPRTRFTLYAQPAEHCLTQDDNLTLPARRGINYLSHKLRYSDAIYLLLLVILACN